MDTEEMRQRIKHIKDYVDKIDKGHDQELMQAYTLFALSDIADVLNALVEQQAEPRSIWTEEQPTEPDEAKNCPDCGYTGGDHHEGCQSKHLSSGYGWEWE